MIITFLEPFNSKLINNLNDNDKSEYLKLLCLCSKSRSIPKTFRYDGDLKLDNIILSGLISCKQEEEKYIEFGIHYLNQKDYDKLIAKYDKNSILEQIENFKNWQDDTKKKTRQNIYATINNWLGKTKSVGLKGIELEFARKSWKAYKEKTNGDSSLSSQTKYYTALEEYFKKELSLDELNSYLKRIISEQVGKTEYIKSMHVAVKEYIKAMSYRSGK
jgi:hypothetical protein